MAEVTERQHKKLEAAVGYFQREVLAAVEAQAGAARKLERAEEELAAAHDNVAAADAAHADALDRLAEARAEFEAATVVVADVVNTPPAVGAGAGDAGVRIENGD